VLADIAQFLIDTLFGFFVFLLLLRFYMQWLRAPFRNPVGEFVTVLSNWMVLPVRRIIPGLFGLDWATLLLAWIAEALRWILLLQLKGMVLGSAGGVALGGIALLAAVELLRLSLYVLIGVILVQVVLSWVNPYTPIAPVLDALTRPFYRPLRRFIPPIGSVDLVPLVVLILAQILLIALATLTQSVSRLF